MTHYPELNLFDTLRPLVYNEDPFLLWILPAAHISRVQRNFYF
jgi:hypothetical protein